MRKAFLKSARDTLVDMKKQLLAEIQQDLKQGREASKDEGMDTYDLASEARDREINFILTDRDRGKLQAIEDALERIDDGSYGMCESCEAEIAEGRLVAMPFTRPSRTGRATTTAPIGASAPPTSTKKATERPLFGPAHAARGHPRMPAMRAACATRSDRTSAPPSIGAASRLSTRPPRAR
jgi:DnaK suppressor protein